MRDVTIAIYVLCLLAALVLTVSGHRPRLRIGRVTEMLDAVLAERAPRVALVVFWWWLGWHFLVGQTVDPPVLG